MTMTMTMSRRRRVAQEACLVMTTSHPHCLPESFLAGPPFARMSLRGGQRRSWSPRLQQAALSVHQAIPGRNLKTVMVHARAPSVEIHLVLRGLALTMSRSSVISLSLSLLGNLVQPLSCLMTVRQREAPQLPQYHGAH